MRGDLLVAHYAFSWPAASDVFALLTSVWLFGAALTLVWIALTLAGPSVRAWLERRVF